jgi:hypothetical protein
MCFLQKTDVELHYPSEVTYFFKKQQKKEDYKRPGQ